MTGHITLYPSSTESPYNKKKIKKKWISTFVTFRLCFQIKASLTFKCMTEHLFADFSYSIPLDTYLWKQMMQMNRKLIHIWYNIDKKQVLFIKR